MKLQVLKLSPFLWNPQDEVDKDKEDKEIKLLKNPYQNNKFESYEYSLIGHLDHKRVK